ncbi:hypothetical protein VTH06DRAFT_7479 [Thermothelomyces fergusii]
MTPSPVSLPGTARTRSGEQQDQTTRPTGYDPEEMRVRSLGFLTTALCRGNGVTSQGTSLHILRGGAKWLSERTINTLDAQGGEVSHLLRRDSTRGAKILCLAAREIGTAPSRNMLERSSFTSESSLDISMVVAFSAILEDVAIPSQNRKQKLQGEDNPKTRQLMSFQIHMINRSEAHVVAASVLLLRPPKPRTATLPAGSPTSGFE